jgi:Icc-related predicted phosphoesterase
MRIFYATDVHGSDICWRKFLNAGTFHKADVLIMGGDMTGKAMVPIVANGSGWDVTIQDQHHALATEAELTAMEKRISDRGYYPIRLSREEVDAWAADASLVDARFKAEIVHGVERWMAIADEKLRGSQIRCIVSPANDDMFEIDEFIERAAIPVLGEAVAIDLEGLTMISTGWTNPTPWNTFRELPEDQLRARIDELDLQLPCPALRLEPRQRAEARRRDELRLRRPGADPGRVARSPGRDPRVRTPALVARAHPRRSWRGEARPYPRREPGQYLRGRRAPGGDRRPGHEEGIGEALSADQRLTFFRPVGSGRAVETKEREACLQ